MRTRDDRESPPTRLAEELNFLVTNRLPRRAATLLAGRLAQIRSRRFTRAALRVWQAFGGPLDLHEAEHDDFETLEACFTRRLKPGARPLAPDAEVVVSPCDAIVGAVGRVEGTTAYQAKGFPYRLEDLLPDRGLVERHRDGVYVTLRLRSTMYHRFHAPCDAGISHVLHVAGDTWNVNPIALRRVERLFCRNERAALPLDLTAPGHALTLVPVAAILVASLVVHGLDRPLGVATPGPAWLPLGRRVAKGDELGFFRNGSTILVFASAGFTIAPGVHDGARLRMGEPLLRLPGVPLSHPPSPTPSLACQTPSPPRP